MQKKSDLSENEVTDNTFQASWPGNEEETGKKTGAGGAREGVAPEERREEMPGEEAGEKEAETEKGTGIEKEAETEKEGGAEKETGEREEEEIPLFSMKRRLTKSRTNKILTGVCGGIGEYFDIDPTLVRLAFVVLAFFSGIGIVIYIILAVIMPEGDSLKMGRDASAFEGRRKGSEGTDRKVKSDRMRLLGAVLLIIGIFLFLDRFHVFEMFRWVDKFFWPVVFTAAGAWLLLRNRE